MIPSWFNIRHPDIDTEKEIAFLELVILQLQMERDHFERTSQEARKDAQTARKELADQLDVMDRERRKWTHMGR